MSPGELAELAAGTSLVEFPAGAVVADYAVHVPGRRLDGLHGTGHPAGEHRRIVIDTIESGGIFGYTPLLTGGGMEFVARATEPSTLIRLPGEQVRAQFAKPAGLAFLASSAWNITPGDRAPRSRSPTAGRSGSWCTATSCWCPPTPRCAMPSSR